MSGLSSIDRTTLDGAMKVAAWVNMVPWCSERGVWWDTARDCRTTATDIDRHPGCMAVGSIAGILEVLHTRDIQAHGRDSWQANSVLVCAAGLAAMTLGMAYAGEKGTLDEFRADLDAIAAWEKNVDQKAAKALLHRYRQYAAFTLGFMLDTRKEVEVG